ncbi:MAG: hypothetical protein JWN20_1819 [Jatrophihabitantaceae bacterium]|nr:hypothetical protein [Jatrophihabitantaceae bacterium]
MLMSRQRLVPVKSVRLNGDAAYTTRLGEIEVLSARDTASTATSDRLWLVAGFLVHGSARV